MVQCVACQQVHPQGSCPLKLAGAEFCNLCGMAHYGYARICPHINSETQVRAMIAAAKQSTEAGHLKKEALKYLRGLKGALVQKKKKDAERAQILATAASGGDHRPRAMSSWEMDPGDPPGSIYIPTQGGDVSSHGRGDDPHFMQQWALGGLGRQ